MTLEGILPYLLPILVLDAVLVIGALYDLTRSERRVLGDNKLVWALVILLVNLIGPILYFLTGRRDE
jgi:hypothetical protein